MQEFKTAYAYRELHVGKELTRLFIVLMVTV